ncbi:cytochrome b [Aureimonas sp. AU22]|jgi:cytochrome b561|uniref:cytochrome b n=1 Tax=Aureimonas sp. AU22 TaxID=1638162 RepID=UPI0009EC71BC|nr:cytochrome b [Aureimonas sp. AU22]
MFVTSRAEHSGVARPRPLAMTIRTLHWLTAGLLVLMFGLAWTFDALGPSDTGASLVALHQSFGLLILVVVAARIVWRVTHPIEPLPGDTQRWEMRLATLVQATLYALLVAMPLVGWYASALSGDTIRFFGVALPDLVTMNEDRSDQLFEIHATIGWAILALTALHVAGALNHQFIRRDGLLNRMRIW